MPCTGDATCKCQNTLLSADFVGRICQNPKCKHDKAEHSPGTIVGMFTIIGKSIVISNTLIFLSTIISTATTTITTTTTSSISTILLMLLLLASILICTSTDLYFFRRSRSKCKLLYVG